jgi:hypothetical protein
MNATTITTHPRIAAAVFAVVVAVGVVPSSQAREIRSEPAAGTSATSPYAEPNPAIGGRTMAQYVADHVERRIHVH